MEIRIPRKFGILANIYYYFSMEYTHLALPTLLAIGALFTFASCAAKPAAQTVGPTPAELLPVPSRSLPAGTLGSVTTPPSSSHDFSSPLPLSDKSGLEYAVLAGGCFWCLEAVFENIPGVVDVVSGYTGGDARRPSYEFVSTGESGHAEAVRIAFDPSKVKLRRLA